MMVKCGHCEKVVDPTVVATHDAAPMGLGVRYTLLHCHECQDAWLLWQADAGDGWSEPAVAYPAPKHSASWTFPRAICDCAEEAVTCLRAEAFTAAVIMCRKTLEAACAERGAWASSLASAIKALRDQGVIDNALFRWADVLRISGNEAVHEVEHSVSREEAEDILTFTMALLEYIYTYRLKFEQFVKRRNLARGKTGHDSAR